MPDIFIPAHRTITPRTEHQSPNRGKHPDGRSGDRIRRKYGWIKDYENDKSDKDSALMEII
jgi:hypothetical protein